MLRGTAGVANLWLTSKTLCSRAGAFGLCRGSWHLLPRGLKTISRFWKGDFGVSRGCWLLPRWNAVGSSGSSRGRKPTRKWSGFWKGPGASSRGLGRVLMCSDIHGSKTKKLMRCVVKLCETIITGWKAKPRLLTSHAFGLV